MRFLIPATFMLALLGALPVAAAAPAAPRPLSATYAATQGGQPLGTATVTLSRAPDGTWMLRQELAGSGGLAGLLGASTSEVSHLRWHDGRFETLSYDYRLNSAIKRRQRHLVVDWPALSVNVSDDKGQETYPAQPGLIERNTLALALGLALAAGNTEVTLPVAVRQRVEQQVFAATGHERITVPAGRFEAERVERTDSAKCFSAWYAPQRLALPVRLEQSGKNAISLRLTAYHLD